MKTIKLSHTILGAWSQGKWEDAVSMYLGSGIPVTPAMELGSLKHKIWENYVEKHKKLPPELGGGELKDPLTERKYQIIIPFSDEYQILLRGVLDLEDNNVITDYKCGFSKPSKYISGTQLDYYKLLRPNATLGRYICHNPYICDAKCTPDNHICYEIGVKFLDDEVAEKALEHIITFGGEMIQYLETQKLIIDYKKL